MKYEFPRITHIEQVRQAIEDRKEFIEADRGEFIVFNYLVSMTDTFPTVTSEREAILRECRGLTFYAKSGRVAARKFHKFFNVNERVETEARKIDLTQKHWILEKLDGSMITPFQRLNGEIEWHTKMGATDVAAHVTDFIKDHPQYNEMAETMIAEDYTPIFEFCSRKQRIVVDHPVDRLVLLAVRHNETGEYLTYERLEALAQAFDVELVKQFKGTAANMADLIEHTRGVEGAEGYVVRFEDGHCVKVKGEWYCSLHKAMSALAHEKDVWQLVLNENADDLKPFLQEADRKRLDEFEKKFWEYFDSLVTILEENFNKAISEIEDQFTGQELAFDSDEEFFRAKKKAFAIDHASRFGDLKGLMFKLYDGHDAREVVKDFVSDNIKTSTKVERLRQHFMGLRWDEIELEE